MRDIFVVLSTASIACACAVRTEHYYLPVEQRLIEEGKVCGSVPFGRANIPLGEAISASVSVSRIGGKLWVALQLALPPGAKARFLSPELGVEIAGAERSYTGRMEPFQVPVYGGGGQPGHYESIAPDSLLGGKGRNSGVADADTPYLKNDLYVSYAVINSSPAAFIVLLFPAVEVNGTVIGPKRIQLKQVERTGLMTCIQ